MSKVKIQETDILKNYKIDNIRLFNRYKLLALNMFKWENLPKGIESRHIEEALFNFGQVVFYKHKDYGFICLPCTGIGTPNILGEDVFVRTSGYNCWETIQLVDSIDNNIPLDSVTYGVRILNNDLKTPSIIDVVDYSNKMNEVEFAIDLNLSQQKFPYIIFTNSNKQLSMKSLIKKIREGEPVIYADNKITFDDLQCFNLNVPFIVKDLQDYKKELEQEILNYFALSSNINKRERVLESELKNDDDYKNRTQELMYQQRLQACDLINSIYGLDMRVVKVNDIVDENVSRETLEDEKEVEDNG